MPGSKQIFRCRSNFLGQPIIWCFMISKVQLRGWPIKKSWPKISLGRGYRGGQNEVWEGQIKCRGLKVILI